MKEAPVEIGSMNYYLKAMIQKLSAIFKELGFNSLLGKLDGAEEDEAPEKDGRS